MNEFAMMVMRLIADNDIYDCLFWRTDGEYMPITFFIKCSDVFTWGMADLEELNPTNIHAFVLALKDVGEEHITDGPLLFCARIRKKRPQGAYYKDIDAEVRHLFDACGPERKIDTNNPKPRHK